MNKKILLTGGTGYIGSHAAVELSTRGYDVVLYDNLQNSSAAVVDQIELISNRKCEFIQGDIRDTALLSDTLSRLKINAVMHFAGLKAVAESIEEPLNYYSTNVLGTLSLLDAMLHAQVFNLVFSSSATVYGVPAYLPIDELHPTGPVNPYGRSKLHAERILSDLAVSSTNWSIISLRYFNPTGAHESGLLGERPTSRPNNLMPIISEVALNSRDRLQVFGDDYDTPDGTGVRDFIHVMDLAEGHRKALEYIGKEKGFEIFNLGTGAGYSVLEMVEAYKVASGQAIPVEIMTRRPGDVGACYADALKADTVLGWQAKRSLKDMCESSWRFYTNSSNRG
ncbi:UDP-glucose 4-epimerase GalE [Shinella sp. H4-D48]|uniref:UDP-glucose 4-epimerase GalE n=1 Tax=Shinella sp. H4-D48 TaxID=2925841 RepID=UPI001F532E40|nr:UDP-glucose 4-epimerase GalE [Shinella sp. H4-D48]UNK38241.1 UDP-glucose 4-epimerase GalE [Shinella sp. H4-D48]